MTFNTAKLDHEFLSQWGYDQLRLVTHELGHAWSDAKMHHGPKWGESCAEVGAALLAANGDFGTLDLETFVDMTQ